MSGGDEGWGFIKCNGCGAILTHEEWLRSEYCASCSELKEHQRGGLAHPHEFIKKKHVA